jgi:hypothetical protein
LDEVVITNANTSQDTPIYGYETPGLDLYQKHQAYIDTFSSSTFKKFRRINSQKYLHIEVEFIKFRILKKS